jgi:hypothetical protein
MILTLGITDPSHMYCEASVSNIIRATDYCDRLCDLPQTPQEKSGIFPDVTPTHHSHVIQPVRLVYFMMLL